jgi:hypothetical protein
MKNQFLYCAIYRADLLLSKIAHGKNKRALVSGLEGK